jgi:hypothetical protein
MENQNEKREEITGLDRNEKNLIIKLRTIYRYGEVIIVMHDGIPQRLKKVETFDDLHGHLSNE